VYDGAYSSFRRCRHGSPVTDQPRERLVICVQNHDQVGNRAKGDRLATLVSPAAQRLACALLLLSANTPLIFMGEEYGETNPFAFFCSFEDPGLIEAVRQGRKREFAELAFRWDGDIPDATIVETFERAQLSWQWENDTQRAGLRSLYQSLLKNRKNWSTPADREHFDARVFPSNEGSPLLVINRGPNRSLTAIANLSAESVTLPAGILIQREALLSTCDRQFGGNRVDPSSISSLMPHELAIWGDGPWK
jgi:maltooligosyltrehalose trehalohydrolase